MAAVRFTSSGDTAFNVEFGETIDRATNARVMDLHARLTRARADGAAPGLVETVPTFRSLMVVYDPVATTRRELEALVGSVIDASGTAGATGALWHLPVCYDTDLAPDLAELAAARGLTPEQAAAVHASGEYFVYMLGFMPGFAYMGGLDAALEQPRRAEPRVKVPAGSVAVAGRLTTVYPWESPGGWHLIGGCPVPLFDAARDRPVLLAAGDRVRFTTIDRARYETLRADAAAGRFDPETLRAKE
ncbi:5-oxoprolinase subunit PxpB [Azospirillum sp. RWY-5-1]|uniref:5-oxoprolinase subunit PxpB n=2 Tax=Azospirillum oleiclasticum TaxID=2735135 RepID=A0ABX2TLG4_9PROT|nr:5-oxoprolinase subunit PxpB [Azospirillum oleiclasticum]NYZ17006.1 5-oxoprolinase subunit PxpB [Azospirillum oleiclasticum]NYZ24550.1 5-oxoprolinase subunit PxpB [Azospirillum oleiclasticum]